jgi:hypothetical protein
MEFRQIAEGTKHAWNGVIDNMSQDPAFIFAPCIPVSRTRPDARQAFSAHFGKVPSCKLAMLMHRNRVVVLSRQECDALSLRLIVDLIWTPAFRSGESWTPFFLREGMHQLYINNHRGSEYAVVMLCSDPQGLVPYHHHSGQILEKLDKAIVSLQTPGDRGSDTFYCWVLHSLAYGQVYISDPDPDVFGDPDPKVSAQKMTDLYRQLATSVDMVETNGVDGEYMFRGETEVIAVVKTKEMIVYGVAKSVTLPDAMISQKLAELRGFIQQHLPELIIVESRVHCERLT